MSTESHKGHHSNGHKTHPHAQSHGASAARTPQTVVGAIGAGIAEQVRKNPYGAVAAALGLGYVLGGGLFTRTTGRLLTLGVKVAMLPAVREPLLDIAENAIDQMLSKAPADTTDA